MLRAPGQFNASVRWSANRHLPAFLERLDGGPVLDVGSGETSVLPRWVDAVSLDLQRRPGIPIQGSACHLPFADASFSSLCHSWVLEHLEKPEIAVNECHRVLRRGGLLYLTANFVWHLHEAPRDFHRFTEYGLRSLFDDALWELEILEPTARFWITLTQMLNYRIERAFSRLHARALHPLITLPAQLLGLALEWLDPDPSVCAGYAVLARKR